MEKKYPNHRIIRDVGSGLNMERLGLKELISLAIEGKLNEVVITYKDRLARFGYDLIEWLIKKYSDGKITIINKKEEETPVRYSSNRFGEGRTGRRNNKRHFTNNECLCC